MAEKGVGESVVIRPYGEDLSSCEWKSAATSAPVNGETNACVAFLDTTRS